MTKDEVLKIEDSDFNNYTKQKLFEYIVELREALSTHPHQVDLDAEYSKGFDAGYEARFERSYNETTN